MIEYGPIIVLSIYVLESLKIHYEDLPGLYWTFQRTKQENERGGEGGRKVRKIRDKTKFNYLK